MFNAFGIELEQFRIGRHRLLADDDGIGAMGIDGGGDDPLGADIGLEKFMNIKCRASGLWPDAATGSG